MGKQSPPVSRSQSDSISPWLLWAKWQSSRQPPSYHPLLCHMVDVANVAQLLWRKVASPAFRHRWATVLGLEQEATCRWFAFWTGLHDIGKASPAFQFKRTDGVFLQQMAEVGLPCPISYDAKMPHGMISDTVLRDLLPAWGIAPELAAVVADAIGGHHGTFASPAQRPKLKTISVGLGAWDEYRHDLTYLLSQALELSEPPVADTLSPSLAIALAGFVSAADWIGSNETYFHHAASDAAVLPQLDLHEYAGESLSRAEQALTQLGWLGWTAPSEARSFKELFPTIENPRPLQIAAERLLPRLAEPGLVVIEAPMGEGKTEAALLLQDHWAVLLGQSGAYVALPTQATSNGMFERIRDFLKGRYGDQIVNLQLLHGHAALSGLFQELQEQGNKVFMPEDVYGAPGWDGASSSVVAAQWFTGRKRGLLAPFGVGTIDQALLSVLPVKHGFVRLYGLMAKTVVIDEVHAYDTYMTTLMERLLCWLGALGSSVVLLSATLPQQRRHRLLRAYARGAQWNVEDEANTTEYPRLSWVTAQETASQHIETSSEIRRNLGLRWINGALPPHSCDPFPLGEQLQAALHDGGCAAVICNTVGRAQAVYTALQHYFPGAADTGIGELDLIHARLLFVDRDRRERRIIERFGKDSLNRPHRAVLVATQVIEQSLDLDFDLIVTDHAPADLILQRAGRLWRHKRSWRPSFFLQPEVWICAPTLASNDVPHFDPGSEYVYDPHILLRSWLELQPRSQVALPEDVEAIIEAVYDDRSAPSTLSAAMRARWEATAREQQTTIAYEQRQAREGYIKLPDYDGPLAQLIGVTREEDAPELHPAHQARTRLIEYSLPVICLHGTDDTPLLDGESLNKRVTPDVTLAKRLLQRSITITHRGVVAVLLEQTTPSSWLKTPLLRNYHLITFNDQNVARVGAYELYLHPELGLIIGGKHDQPDV
ncbi:MAG: CRISPR-associated helicase Cas3' [Herpetosiphonaceae bacterium]|nr:CRISPR-associated helicase Cas3' [Herpetosiphonaceae bacterium]